VSLGRPGWPAAAKDIQPPGDTAQHGDLRQDSRELKAVNRGTGHPDAGQRHRPPLRTAQNVRLIPALCERHDDTSPADRYGLLHLTEPDPADLIHRHRDDFRPAGWLTHGPSRTATRHERQSDYPSTVSPRQPWKQTINGQMPEHPGPGAYSQAPVPERYSGRYPQYQEDQGTDVPRVFRSRVAG